MECHRTVVGFFRQQQKKLSTLRTNNIFYMQRESRTNNRPTPRLLLQPKWNEKEKKKMFRLMWSLPKHSQQVGFSFFFLYGGWQVLHSRNEINLSLFRQTNRKQLAKPNPQTVLVVFLASSLTSIVDFFQIAFNVLPTVSRNTKKNKRTNKISGFKRNSCRVPHPEFLCADRQKN